MCTSYLNDMISEIQSAAPFACGSGVLAGLAIASATQAVSDLCAWDSSGGPQTIPAGAFSPTLYAFTPAPSYTPSPVGATTQSLGSYGYSHTSGGGVGYGYGTLSGSGTVGYYGSGRPYGSYSTAQGAQQSGTSGSGPGYFGAFRQSSGLDPGAIAGITIGGIVALLLVAALALGAYRRRWKRRITAAAAMTQIPVVKALPYLSYNPAPVTYGGSNAYSVSTLTKRYNEGDAYAGFIAGLVLSGIVFLLLIIFVPPCICKCRRQKRLKREAALHPERQIENTEGQIDSARVAYVIPGTSTYRASSSDIDLPAYERTPSYERNPSYEQTQAVRIDYDEDTSPPAYNSLEDEQNRKKQREVPESRSWASRLWRVIDGI